MSRSNLFVGVSKKDQEKMKEAELKQQKAEQKEKEKQQKAEEKLRAKEEKQKVSLSLPAFTPHRSVYLLIISFFQNVSHCN